MKKTISRLLIIAGFLLIIAAAALAGYNYWDSQKAGAASEEIVEEIEKKIGMDFPDRGEENSHKVPDNNPTEEQGKALFEIFPTMDMPAVVINGYRYIGVLQIPSIGRTLPVMEEWDYSRLKISPCRYTGSAYTGDIVIAGHNYYRHFSPIKHLPEGTEVILTDMEGNVFYYTVGWADIVDPTDLTNMTTELEGNPWDMTLFTCTTGGASRYALRCILEDIQLKE